MHNGLKHWSSKLSEESKMRWEAVKFDGYYLFLAAISGPFCSSINNSRYSNRKEAVIVR